MQDGNRVARGAGSAQAARREVFRGGSHKSLVSVQAVSRIANGCYPYYPSACSSAARTSATSPASRAAVERASSRA